ncbi:hypothetical protein [Romboutsia lituseburensis]|uniref:hypothetical protein n=1 Tax=Romboutsia lituseburensis TaxID=1537 RepID=UPI00215A14FE|nr:hypothetical protein [Romboutsia lituseburensis]MCR8746904.1 hypothetical protein [Romboutsia lituseburensis]
MKDKFKYIIPLFIVGVIVFYTFFTPIGALKFAVLREGYPNSAINLKVDYSSCRDPIEKVGNQIVYTIFNYPIEEKTQTPLDSWIISRYGIFYWGEYYTV